MGQLRLGKAALAADRLDSLAYKILTAHRHPLKM
ncbi:MAG: hypothetical protein JWQ95_6927 [Sphaerisporangium sp.]|nr:hypothetical protein [Sphaerisporangium sp.]